ncbi:hypothetical protein HOY80DRAFT_950037 [Tuber brumale]|nr:hypothetical protein HOY80DRAFT_950037 [Tuber brumale]
MGLGGPPLPKHSSNPKDIPPPPPPHNSQSKDNPPPPPHNSTPSLPPANYEVFIIPQDAGGGIVYLPNLKTHRNSFIVGVVSTLVVQGLLKLLAPVFRYYARGLGGLIIGILLVFL